MITSLSRQGGRRYPQSRTAFAQAASLSYSGGNPVEYDPHINKAIHVRRVALQNGKLHFIPLEGFCGTVEIDKPVLAKRTTVMDDNLHFLLSDQMLTRDGKMVMCKPYFAQRAAQNPDGSLHFLVSGKKECPAAKCCFLDRFGSYCIPPIRFVIESPDFATIDSGPLPFAGHGGRYPRNSDLYWGDDWVHYRCQGYRWEFVFHDNPLGSGRDFIFYYYSTQIPNIFTSPRIVPNSCEPFLFIHSATIQGGGSDYGMFSPLYDEGNVWARSGGQIAGVSKEGSAYTITAYEV